jgi:WD40 repeat protein
MHKLQAEGIACADIDLTGIVSKQSTEEQWYRDIIKELVSCFQLKVNRRTWWREHDDLSCVHRFSVFVEEVLLADVKKNIVIFVDEIDSVLSLDFPIDDFFAQIRYFYNKRANKAEYKRLTFALLGVATPSDLIADKNRTPFNIGRAIELYGFQPHETSPLAQGLVGKVSNPQAVLREVLQWTGGQPFLTQKLCQLVLIAELSIPEGNEAEWMENLVRSHVIENWESQDDPEHLRTIRDRILSNEQRTSRLLGLYQQILIPPQPPLTKGGEQDLPPLKKGGQEGIAADDSSEQMELRLSGLVVKQNCQLRVYNRIYEAVFNQTWVNQQLAKLRPYSEAITAWLKSNCQDESRLLQGKALEKALDWAEDKSLSAEDYAFLTASQKQINLILAEAKRKAEQLLTEAEQKKQEAEQKRKQAQEGTKIERAGVKALQLFETGGREIEALLLAMQAGQALQKWVKDGRPLQDYPATSPLLALQVILNHIREWNQLSGHQKGVRSVSFSPNGKYIATASWYGKARLWNLSGNQIARFIGHQDGVNSISFSPNGEYIATASRDRTARLWDLSGNQIAQLKGHQDIVWSVSFSPNGEYIATASSDCTAKLWNLSGNQLAEFHGHQNWVWDVSFSPDGECIATASSDCTIRLWDLFGNQIDEFLSHQAGFTSISFSPNGQYIAATLSNNSVLLWDLFGNQIAEFTEDDDDFFGYGTASFSPDSKYIATTSKNGSAKVWDLSKNQIAEFKGHQGLVMSISFSPDGKYIATASDSGSARLWNLFEKQLASFKGHSVSFSPDSNYIATASNDNPARLWDFSGNQLAEFSGHDVIFSPNGEYIATASDDGTATLWDLSGNQLVEFKGHQQRVSFISFSLNGEYIATTSLDWTARLWDLSGNQVAEFAADKVTLSPDGKYVATALLSGKLKLWNLSGSQIAELDGHQGSIWSVSFSPNSEYIASASDQGTVRLWDLSGNQIIEFNGHHGAVWSLSFSPNGEYIATASSDFTARLWDLSGNQIVEFNGHHGAVSRVSFSPDGKYIATASDDGTARLWDLSGNQIAEFKGHQGRIWSVSFSPDMKYIAIASYESTRLWRVEGLDELLARGCDWLKYYLACHPEAREKLKVCQN